MKVLFYPNELDPRALAARERLERMALERGFAAVREGRADITIALGGDGTILRAVRAQPRSAMLGFNMGSLGYLASVGEDGFEKALDMLAAGRYRIVTRSLIEASLAGARAKKAIALNEIVLMREMTGHAACLDLAADSRRVTRYSADGLVIATPTGSTAYSLAAGGPVLMPDTGCFVVTPMNPHALGIRPLVVGDAVKLSVTTRRRVNGKAEKIGVYADGEQVMILDCDETLVVKKARVAARFVELEGYNAFDVLSRKLGWSGSSAK